MDYARLYRESLRLNRPKLYEELRRRGELEQHVQRLAEDAQAMYDRVLKDLQEANPFRPEQWKGNREAWLAALKRSARELVNHDLVLVPNEEDERDLREGYRDETTE
jgi:hypothetical protein